MKVALVIPTYNEKETIGRLLQKLQELKIANLNVIIVDDNSPDGTAALVRKFSQKHPSVRLISRPGKLGLGSAYKAGFRLARKLGAEVIMTMDADLSHNPKYIPGMLAKLANYDLVIGSRLMPGGKILGFGLGRLTLSHGAKAICRFLLGMRIHDSTSGFRAYRAKVLKAIRADGIKSEGYSFLIEAAFLCQKQGIKIGEIPIVFDERGGGVSKVSQTEIFKALLTVLRLTFS